MPRYYGTCELKKNANGRKVWAIECEPHVSMRLKRVFGKLHKGSAGRHVLTDTADVARDLAWFMDRYPLEMSDATRRALAKREHEHREHESLVETMLARRGDIPTFELAVPARDYQRVAATLAMRSNGLLIADEVGLGKQNPVDTPVLTPDGWRPIGVLHVGDFVIGSDGRATRVLGVYPQGVKPSYMVRFSDGSGVEAGPEHLWTVGYWCGGRRWEERVVTTDQIRTGATIETKWPNGVTGRMCLGKTTLQIPMLSGPVIFADCDEPLPIPPYTMGQLIANGALTETIALTVNTTDWPEIEARLQAEGAHIGSVHRYGKATRAGINGIRGHVRSLGLAVVSGIKKLPPIYMRSGIAARVALLQGLMDGDGSCSARGNRVTYTTTSPDLADDVRELVEQLGGIATVREYDRSHHGKPTDYQVRVRLPLDIEPFTTRRKASRLTAERRPPRRTIVGVDYVRKVESVCIKVEAEDALYAVKHCILTHNTATAICTFTDPKFLPALVVTLTHLPGQWEAEIKKFAPSLRTHILQRGEPYDITLGKAGAKKRSGGGDQLMLPGKIAGEFPDVVICNYHKLSNWAETLAPFIQSIVFDEAQELRHDGTDKYRGAVHLSENVRSRIGLTATPIYNYGGEIHNVLEVIKPDALGSWDEFATEWCEAAAERRKARIADPKAFGMYLRDAGVMLRRTRSDVGRELPPIQKIRHPIESDPAELARIQSSAAELARTVLAPGRGFDKMRAAEELSMLVRQATGIGKALFVADFVRLLVESGEKVVVYAWHRTVYRLISERIDDLGVVMFTGSESTAQKKESFQRFTTGEAKVLLMSLRSGAGLDGLQHHCRTVVFAELDWSPGVHEQCIGRVARDGQPDSVVVYFLVSETGSDPIIADVLDLKSSQIEGIRDPNGALIEQLAVDPDHIKKLAARYLEQHDGGKKKASDGEVQDLGC